MTAAGDPLARALAAHRAGDLAAADEAYKAVLATQGHRGEVWALLGRLYLDQGRVDEALAVLDKALLLAPALVDAHLWRGAALAAQNQPATDAWRAAAVLAPAAVAPVRQRAEAALAAEDDPRRWLIRLLVLDPALGSARGRLAALDLAADRLSAPEAAVALTRALVLAPGDADNWCDRGVATLRGGRPAAALAPLDRALALEPGLADAWWNRSLALLGAGRYAEGFALYHWRRRALPHLAPPPRPQPEWDGAPLAGTLLVHGDQAFGDNIFFARWLGAARARVGRLVYGGRAPLLGLFAAHEAVDAVVDLDAPAPDCAAWIALSDLPAVLGAAPAAVPYLPVPDRPLAPPPGRSIALVWSGRASAGHDRRRSLPVAALAPLTRAPVFAAQVGAGADDLAWLAARGVPDLAPSIHDFADSAALLARCDLVISVDSAPANLAGALGRPVWVLLSHGGDWRYPVADPAAWYPTARIFRQDRPGDWPGVIARVAAALAEDWQTEGGGA